MQILIIEVIVRQLFIAGGNILGVSVGSEAVSKVLSLFISVSSIPVPDFPL